MYENVTYEDILQRMLDRVPENMDKREGSIIYDALAPAAVELQLMYIEFDVILKETFGDTASREYLIRRAAERGITPQPATYAFLKAKTVPSDLQIPLNSRFSLNDLNYYVVEKISDGEYKMQCETIGKIGNGYFGDMIPIDYIQGLESIELTDLLIPGEDEEDTELLRQRYFDSFDSKAYGGNVDDYLNKTNSLPGVGSTKVTSVWNGGGTVLLTILNSEYGKASDTLIQTVQEEIDPTQDGSGIGIAPIGHIVTVETASEVAVNVSASITFEEGYSWTGQKTAIEEAVKGYLLEIRKEWANQSASVVRIAQIESRIMALKGVLDIANTKINDSESNLMLTKYQIPVFGGVVND